MGFEAPNTPKEKPPSLGELAALVMQTIWSNMNQELSESGSSGYIQTPSRYLAPPVIYNTRPVPIRRPSHRIESRPYYSQGDLQQTTQPQRLGPASAPPNFSHLGGPVQNPPLQHTPKFVGNPIEPRSFSGFGLERPYQQPVSNPSGFTPPEVVAWSRGIFNPPQALPQLAYSQTNPASVDASLYNYIEESGRRRGEMERQAKLRADQLRQKKLQKQQKQKEYAQKVQSIYRFGLEMKGLLNSKKIDSVEALHYLSDMAAILAGKDKELYIRLMTEVLIGKEFLPLYPYERTRQRILFGDSGMAKEYRDSSPQQMYHFWAYVVYGYYYGQSRSEGINVIHELIEPTLRSDPRVPEILTKKLSKSGSKADVRLSRLGAIVGGLLKTAKLSPKQAGVRMMTLLKNYTLMKSYIEHEDDFLLDNVP